MSTIVTGKFAEDFNDLTEDQLTTILRNLAAYTPQVGIFSDYTGATLKAPDDQAEAAAVALKDIVNHVGLTLDEVLVESREVYEARMLAEAEANS